MENRKLRVGFITNCVTIKTGLGRNAKALVPLLYEKNKYDIYFLNQQMPDNHPDFQRLPWVNEGAMKNFNQQQFQQDQNYQRIVAYGNLAVEDFVTKNKLDVVFALDDPWAFLPDFYFKKEWFKHIKDNFVSIITIDSEPVLPLIKEWAQNSKNMWFWASFGERLLKEENYELYKHCKTQYPAFNVEHFKPLSEQERKELRAKFNIKKDEKIIIYVARNQLRKLFFSHMEALRDFQKKYPDKKIKLLFHTSWSEPAGWPLNGIREELKLKKEDILTTYYCKSCGDWNIQPYEGENLNCSVCSKQRERITAGISSTIDEENLNKIYNLADGACSVATSGGSELFSQESMLAGIPFASFDYSCGEDYVKNDFVFPIRGTFTREVNTSFKKFVPNISTMVNFYEFIYDLTSDKKIEITRKARKWTIENFEASKVAEKYEKFIDSCKPINWDEFFKKKDELKNPNAQIPNIEDDYEFINRCYIDILNMRDMNKEKPEVIHWLNFLKQNKDKNQLKQELIVTFKNVAAQKNAEQNKINFEDLLDKNDKGKRILIVQPESIGDVFLITSLLKSMKELYPDYNIYFGTKSENFEVLDMNPYIFKVLQYMPEMNNIFAMEGNGTHKGYFDLCFLPFVTSQLVANYMHGGLTKFGFNIDKKE